MENIKYDEDYKNPFSGENYIEDNIYSEQHGKNKFFDQKFYPKNSLRTFISGNSRLSKIHFYSSTNSVEKQLKLEIEELKLKIISLSCEEQQKILLSYKTFFDLYRKHNKKKNKNKLFIYTIYNVMKNTKILVTHKKIAELFNCDKKDICKAIKDVDIFLEHTLYDTKNGDTNGGINGGTNGNKDINELLEKLNIDLKFSKEINELYLKLLDDNEFKKHKYNSILAGIMFSYNPQKFIISELTGVSPTTVISINKKITKLNYN